MHRMIRNNFNTADEAMFIGLHTQTNATTDLLKKSHMAKLYRT